MFYLEMQSLKIVSKYILKKAELILGVMKPGSYSRPRQLEKRRINTFFQIIFPHLSPNLLSPMHRLF